MTYLELCQSMIERAGISGSIVSVSAQTGEYQRVVNWVRAAYRYVLNKNEDWTFLRKSVEFPCIIGQREYSAAAVGVANFGRWMFNTSWRAYRADLGYADEQPIRYLSYEQFRTQCLYSSNRAMTSRPLVVTHSPDETLLFWPLPDMVYGIVGEQYAFPPDLTMDSDVPVFAARFHSVIVQRALMLYGEYEGDASVYQAAQNECAKLIGDMEARYLPEWQMSEPMA